MRNLAVASLRSRSTAFTACFLSVLLGATVLGAFATLVANATGDVSAVDRETLLTMGAVVGGWGLIIVLFSVASTLTLTVQQRSAEIAVLRLVGATSRQARRMIMAETLLVAAAASVLAAVPAWLAGRGLFALLGEANLVSQGVDHQAGLASVGGTTLAILIVTGAAAALAARRATKGTANAALVESAAGRHRMSRWRTAGAVVFLLAGLNCSVLTVTVMADSEDPFAPMATAGPVSGLLSVGLAMLTPLLLRGVTRVVGGVLRHVGAAGHLTVYDASRRSQLLAGMLMPVIIFVGMATGTLYMMAIENTVTADVLTSDDAKAVELLNYVVVGMISAFAAIMVVNTMASVVSARRREFGQQRLAGATPGQVVATMLLEGALVAVTGVVLGGLASLHRGPVQPGQAGAGRS